MAILGLMLSIVNLPAKFSGSSGGKVQVKGYTMKVGTYVEPHDRTAPNSKKTDNWSAKGNSNPETGKAGTVNPSSPSPAKKK